MAATSDIEMATAPAAGEAEEKQASPRLAAVPEHHIERKQTWAGHGLHRAYELDWGPIIHAVMGFDERVDRERLEEVLARELVQYVRVVRLCARGPPPVTTVAHTVGRMVPVCVRASRLRGDRRVVETGLYLTVGLWLVACGVVCE